MVVFTVSVVAMVVAVVVIMVAGLMVMLFVTLRRLLELIPQTSIINSYGGVTCIVRTFLMVGLGLIVLGIIVLGRNVETMVRLVRPIMRRFVVLQEASGLKFKR